MDNWRCQLECLLDIQIGGTTIRLHKQPYRFDQFRCPDSHSDIFPPAVLHVFIITDIMDDLVHLRKLQGILPKGPLGSPWQNCYPWPD